MRARPSDAHGRPRSSGLYRGPGGARGALPAQAHVAAWVAERARGSKAGLGADLDRAILMVGPQRSKSLSHFLFLIFPVINGSKKIGKENFPVGKIQQLCS